MKPAISVIIPAHNEERYIRRCLESISAARAAARIEVEIIVVLNRCTDRTGFIARSYGARCIVEDRRCLAAVRNAGVRASTADVVVTIDADSWMSANAFTEILRLLRSGRTLGGGCLMRPERWSVGIVFSLLVVFPYLIRPRVSAGMFWLRRKTFDELNGFDERLVSVEDLDFAVRLKRLAKSRGLRYGTLLRALITTSCRKFDQFGDWHPFLNPGLVRRLFSGSDVKAADHFYYDTGR